MDSDDGGADENVERQRSLDMSLQDLTEDHTSQCEGASKSGGCQPEDSNPSKEDEDGGDGSKENNAEKAVNDADNNPTRLNEPVSDMATQDKVSPTPEEHLEENRRISDAENGEEIILSDAHSTDTLSPRVVPSRKSAEDDNLDFEAQHSATADSSVGEDGSAEDNAVKESSTIKDADGTVKEAGAVSQNTTASEAPPGKNQSGEEVDEELQNFFMSAQPGVGKFPGLDNVDLTSDEDSHGGGGGGGNREAVAGDGIANGGGGVRVVELSPNGGSDQPEDNPEDGEEEEAEFIALVDKEGTTNLKDFPLNYNNYKVCKEVGPGVKKCLVLETGEQLVCVVKPKGPLPSSSASSGVSDCVHPFASSSPRTTANHMDKGGSITEADLLSQRLPPSVTTTTTIVSPAEAFAYVSFEGDDDKLLPEGGGGEGGGQQHFVLTESQQAFITENGIPVILDNAEDDLKLDLQAKMDRLGKVTAVATLDGQSLPNAVVNDDDDVVVNQEHREDALAETQENEPVADVLSSGGDGDPGSQHSNASKPTKKMKRKKDKKQRFYELQPDDLADGTDEAEDSAGLNRSNNSVGSHGNGSRQPTGENRNNSAFERDRVGDLVYDGSEAPGRKFRPLHGTLHSDELNSRRFLASDVSGLDSTAGRSTFSDSHSQRHWTSRGDNSYSRSYGERLPFDSSRLSTRYSHIDRGDPSLESSTQESLTIPRFRTLHDQQVSWVEMFQMIEDQHRSELQSQYSDHQRVLQELQRKMELELSRQQDSLKHRLQTHKEILQELSPGRRGLGSDVTGSPRVQEGPYQHASHTTIDGTPVTLKYPPPLRGHMAKTGGEQTQGSYSSKREPFEQASVTKTAESEFLRSPTQPSDTSLNLSEVTSSGEKLLRGGVYSSPMPLAKARHRKAKSGRPSENKSHNSVWDRSSHTATSSYGDQAPTSFNEELGQESDDLTSPRSRVSLREKHAKHVADLRAYYEEELKEMRKILTSRQTGDDLSRDGGTSTMAPGDRILANENAELRQRSQELEDECHDLKIEIRELQQKIQGLEIRACDYAERYDKSQSQVRTLHARLEEVTEFAKEKEAAAADLKAKSKNSENSLQAVYKKEKELTDSLHAAKTTIQRLVEKYESLEKDQQLLKESLAEKDDKLFVSRKEAMDANNKLSRLELDNKQLLHDKDVLKHELTMARSSLTSNVHTAYEDAFHGTAAPTSNSRSSRNVTSGIRSRSKERSGKGSLYDGNAARADPSPDSETESEVGKSPIMKAERELKKLRESVGQSQEFAPKLQRKFYGTEAPLGTGSMRGSTVSSPGRPASKSKSGIDVTKSSSPKDKKGRHEAQNGIKGGSTGRSGGPTSSHSGKSPNVRDSKATKYREPDRIIETHVSAETDRLAQETLKRLGLTENGLSGDQALERIKMGEIVSRPAWEDIYTSMAPARPTGHGEGRTNSKANTTKDQMLRERLQTIDMMERKYDDLAGEKRKFESALSRVPAHGSRRERERLEAELDRVDRELGSVRMSLKRFHVLKSTI